MEAASTMDQKASFNAINVYDSAISPSQAAASILLTIFTFSRIVRVAAFLHEIEDLELFDGWQRIKKAFCCQPHYIRQTHADNLLHLLNSYARQTSCFDVHLC